MTLGIITKYKSGNQVNLSFYDIVKYKKGYFGTAFYCIDVITSKHVNFYLTKDITELQNIIYSRHYDTISQWFSLNDDLLIEKYKELTNEPSMLDLADW